MSREKIVITGLGVLAPNGNNVDEFWASCTAGKSGIGPITYFDASNHRASIAGELSDFQPEKVLDPKEIRKLDPFSVYALVATDEAIKMANIDFKSIDLDRVGVTIGSGVGGIQTLEEQHSVIENKGARRVSPHFVPTLHLFESSNFANTSLPNISNKIEFSNNQYKKNKESKTCKSCVKLILNYEDNNTLKM